MNLLIPVLSKGRGGLEMYALNLARKMNERGHHVVMATQKNSFTDRKRRDQGIPGETVDGWRYVDVFLLKQLLGIVDEHDVDLIHTHKSQDIWYGAYLKWLRPKLSLFFTQHMRPGEKKDLAHRLIYRAIDRFIVISDDVRKAVLENCPIDEKNVTKIYYGLDADRFVPETGDEDLPSDAPAKDGKVTIGLVGRIDPVKRHDVFLKAARILRDRGVEANFWIVGDTVDEKDEDFKQELRNYIDGNELGESVEFLGHVDEVQAIYRELDINCMTTDAEHFGKVIQESQAMKVPVVVSAGGGAPEALDPGRTGLLFEPGNPRELADCLEELIENPDERRRMSTQARQFVQDEFSYREHFDAIEREYEKFLSE